MTPDARACVPAMEVGDPVRALVLGSHPENGVLARARHGDAEAFTELYHRHKRAVWDLAVFLLRNRQEAEDATQETFLKAYRGLARCRRDEDVPAWLMKICRNTCLDRVRAAGRRGPLVSFADEEPAARVQDHDRVMDLRRALTELPAEDVEAFFLVDVLGFRSEEASRIVGVRAASTLRSRLGRARQHVVATLGNGDDAVARNDNAAKLWGVYHSPSQNAVVVAYADEPGGEAACDGAALDDLRACLSAGRPGHLDREDLVPFFDRLDGRIPRAQRVLALVDGASPGNGDWVEGHPRWRVRSTHTHAAWLREAMGLVRKGRETELLGLIDDVGPFEWTHPA
jgi:RNA polymerase sigma factor (sigma-70 family)